MTGVENNELKIGTYIVAAFCYQGINIRKVFLKISATHYKLMNKKKIVSYRSLHTLDKARKNESV